ncbi:MAG: hypothetical protein SOZ62_04855 [Eubacteriales bacterium]|nr:hypothetical protein [Eubacteriales bacterium]
MPVGKNSIRRVANNGYSKVKTEAPDMENSKIVTIKKSTTVKNASTKKDNAVSDNVNLVKAKGILTPVDTKTEKSFVNVGDDMPYYLL